MSFPRSLISFLSIALLSTQISAAQKLTASQRIDKLVAETSLDHADAAPWHLRMSFDLFDLNGNPQESGTVEEWWASPTRHRTVITSPSLNQTLSTPPPQQAIYSRESYLVHLLLRQTVHPVDKIYTHNPVTVENSTRSFGKTTLTCMKMTIGHSPFPDGEYCSDPEKKDLRVVLQNAEQSYARNEISHFENTEIALSDAIAFNGQVAIRGHVDLIEKFDPTQVAGLSGAVPAFPQDTLVPPHLTTRDLPKFPDDARSSGIVLMRMLISKEGKPTSVEFIASSSPNFQRATLEAVENWRYKPMLRNGIPSEIDSTISVTFMPLGRTHSQPYVKVDERMNDSLDR